jgi:hypothetical protein
MVQVIKKCLHGTSAIKRRVPVSHGNAYGQYAISFKKVLSLIENRSLRTIASPGASSSATEDGCRVQEIGYFYLLYAGRPETITVSRGGSAGEGYIPRNEVLGYVP